MSTTKLTLNLPNDLVKRLKEKAAKHNITMTEAIRKGIETELFLTEEEDEGSKILLEKKDKQIVQLVRR